MNSIKRPLVLVVLLVAVALGVAVWQISRQPPLPPHPAIARVVAIAPVESRWYANRDRIVVRSAHGTGQFEMIHSDVRCDVGDEVPVEQRGITLTRLPKTCR